MGKPLSFYPYREGDKLVKSEFFNVFEPLRAGGEITPSVVIVPMLGFDVNKNRIGYGGGFYDRTLAKLDCLKVGVAFEFQKVQNLPID